MNSNLFDFLISHSKKSFLGWDFSYIEETERVAIGPLKWSYVSEILPKLKKVQNLLDIGTGGGELLSLLQPLPKNTFALESYEPNVLIARKKLEPLGVEVYRFDDNNNLPFDDNQFELIINRHSSYSPKQLLRILKTNGEFITQQVGGENNLGLNKMLGADIETANFGMQYWNLEYAVKELKDVGIQIIEEKEDFPITRFFDVGAVVYYLKAVPWQVPDFSVEKYSNTLKKIHNEIKTNGYIEVKSHRFFIIAKKD